MSVFVAAVLAGAVLACGCYRANKQSVGPRIPSAENLRPDANPGQKAVLVLGGIPVPVEVRASSQGEYLTFQLVAHDVVLEEERYRRRQDGFDLIAAAGEAYSPPLPLLKFPMSVGDSWEWKGKLEIGAPPTPARAVVSTSSEPLNVSSRSDSSLKVHVRLQIEGGGPKPAERSLSFWFVPGKGLLRREFGQSSARIPPEPETASER